MFTALLYCFSTPLPNRYLPKIDVGCPWDNFSSASTKTILDRASDLLTPKNGDFGAISVTERSCDAQISKCRISYRIGQVRKAAGLLWTPSKIYLFQRHNVEPSLYFERAGKVASESGNALSNHLQGSTSNAVWDISTPVGDSAAWRVNLVFGVPVFSTDVRRRSCGWHSRRLAATRTTPFTLKGMSERNLCQQGRLIKKPEKIPSL